MINLLKQMADLGFEILGFLAAITQSCNPQNQPL